MDTSFLLDKTAKIEIFLNGTMFIGHSKNEKQYDGFLSFDNGDFFIGTCIDSGTMVVFVTGILYDKHSQIIRKIIDSKDQKIPYLKMAISNDDPILPVHLYDKNATRNSELLIYDDGTVFRGKVSKNKPAMCCLSFLNGKYYIGTFDNAKFVTGKVYTNDHVLYSIVTRGSAVHALTQKTSTKKDVVH